VAANIFHRTLVGTMQYVPQPIIWRFSQRYIAGTELDDAYQTVRELNEEGCVATVDVLGEDSTTRGQVDAALALYEEALQGIRSSSRDCNISVKLSEWGVWFVAAAGVELMQSLLSSAGEQDNFVRIDMEDSSVTSRTLDIYSELRQQFGNVGVVIQSCLKRSENDVANLLDSSSANVRLCKGIYIEPPEIAYQSADDIRSSFQALLEQLLQGNAERVAIATHDPILVAHAEETINKLGTPKDRYEFQMLLGVAGPLRRTLIEKGHPLRVYVPFGKLWFNYSMRRLRENPHIAVHIIKNLLSPN
jgi:proline dehydrogenase